MWHVTAKTSVAGLIVSTRPREGSEPLGAGHADRLYQALERAFAARPVIETYERLADGARKVVAGPFLFVRSPEEDFFHWFTVPAKLIGRDDRRIETDDSDRVEMQHYVDALAQDVGNLVGRTIRYDFT